jgi:glycylpeptide N-tetradecanoyltransferase
LREKKFSKGNNEYLIDLFIRALLPPHQRKSWLIGVRVAANKKLVAFISGIPVAMRTYEK